MRTELPSPAGRVAPRTLERVSAAAVVALALLAVLWLHVLGVLISALAAHSVYRRLIRLLERKLPARTATVAAILFTVLALAILAWAAWQATRLLSSPTGGVPSLLQFLAETLDRLRASLPAWIADRIPQSADDFTRVAASWLRAHAQKLQLWGHAALRAAAHVLVGLIIGLLAAFERKPRAASPWAVACAQSLGNVARAFDLIVSAQVRIALINTVLTAAYVFAVLPLAGTHLPLARTLVAVTLLTGFVPIVGNLVSSAAIVIASLAAGTGVTLASVAFLLGVHKLEYFLNAHFVGRSANVPAFCLLAGIVALEAAFGVSGLLAAPIYCAWLFGELQAAGVLAPEPPR
jgi:predicted PurR-regulated permease PerM